MKIKERFEVLTEKLGLKLENGIERIINSHMLKRIEDGIIGDDYMPRGRKEATKTIDVEHTEPYDRMCICPMRINGTVFEDKVYCAVCQGLIGCVEETVK